MRRLLSAFTESSNGAPVYDNTRRVARLAYRFYYYSRVALSAFGHISPLTMLRTHFTFLIPDTFDRPANLTIEFTNHCNLRCNYCTSPLGIRTRGFMDDSTFTVLINQLKEFPIPRLRIVGNGEPTLHPNFCAMVKRLGTACSYLQMVTNAQRLTESVVRAFLSAPVRLLEISADSLNKDGYERSRIGGNFERLVRNLNLISSMKRALNSPTVVNIRAMIRPSERRSERDILRFWSQYADTVMPQYLQ